MNEAEFQLEWDEKKATANQRKHGVSFDLASSVFRDPHLLTVADVEHGETEERWFSVGCASNGAIVPVKSGPFQPAGLPALRLVAIWKVHERTD